MARETGRRQPNKEQGGTRRASLSMRSPALESAEKRRANLPPEPRQRRVAPGRVQGGGSRRNVRYAAEESLYRPAIARSRKRLPGTRVPLGERLSQVRAQFVTSSPEGGVKNVGVQFNAPSQARDTKRGDMLLSEEEQKKLDTLEMTLPRVAGKIDSWLLIFVLALLCIGVVMVYSASSFIAARDQGDASYYFQRELIWLVLGIVAMLVTMRVDYRYWRRISLLAMACGGLILLKEAFRGYRYYRITGFLHPFKDITSINLQLHQALLGLGSGGWFGLGLGASRQKTGYLPFPYTDSIFPVIGEELGFVGCSIIVILFLFLAFRGFRLARRSPDIYGSLLATGITTWLILQAMINIGANTGTIPYTGVPLPFISFGGSSLVVSLAAVGVLLNMSRYIQEPEAPALSLRKKRVGSRYITSTQ